MSDGVIPSRNSWNKIRSYLNLNPSEGNTIGGTFGNLVNDDIIFVEIEGTNELGLANTFYKGTETRYDGTSFTKLTSGGIEFGKEEPDNDGNIVIDKLLSLASFIGAGTTTPTGAVVVAHAAGNQNDGADDEDYIEYVFDSIIEDPVLTDGSVIGDGATLPIQLQNDLFNGSSPTQPTIDDPEPDDRLYSGLIDEEGAGNHVRGWYKIRDILDNAVKNSIEVDAADGKLQLVDDLTDVQLATGVFRNYLYMIDEFDTRGFDLLGVDKSVVINVANDNNIELDGDVAAPGNRFYYGTNDAGVKSFYDLTAYINSLIPPITVNTQFSVTGDGSIGDPIDLENDIAAGASAISDGVPAVYGFNDAATRAWYTMAEQIAHTQESIEWETAASTGDFHRLHLINDLTDVALSDGMLYGYTAATRGWADIEDFLEDLVDHVPGNEQTIIHLAAGDPIWEEIEDQQVVTDVRKFKGDIQIKTRTLKGIWTDAESDFTDIVCFESIEYEECP